MHKREDHSTASPAAQEISEPLVSGRSPAKDRAADADVKRATRGLIRLEKQRRTRVLIRLMTVLLIVTITVAAVAFYAADYVPTERWKATWESWQSTFAPVPES